MVAVHRGGGIQEAVRPHQRPGLAVVAGAELGLFGAAAPTWRGALCWARVGCRTVLPGGLVVGGSACWVGSLPAALQAMQQAGFDFGGDVAVDFDESVGEVVAESAGLGDFGNVVGDQPGFMTVPQPMKCQPGSDRIRANSGVGSLVVAVHRRSEDTAVKCTAPQWIA